MAMECSMMLLFFAVFVFCMLIGWRFHMIALSLMFLLFVFAGILWNSTWFLPAGMVALVLLLLYDESGVV